MSLNKNALWRPVWVATNDYKVGIKIFFRSTNYSPVSSLYKEYYPCKIWYDKLYPI